MKGAILSSLVTAGTVAAQLTVAPELFQVAAVQISDPEYTTCSVVADYVDMCVTQLGGSDALSTADPADLLSCACCASATPVYGLYSACSSYLSAEGGRTYTEQVSAYSVIYKACDASAACGAANSEPTASAVASTTKERTVASATITGTAEQTYAVACSDMIDIWTSCTKKDADFTNLPNKDQASCFCCRTAGSTLSYTTAMDRYASTCADWAITGEPDTAYSVAKTFASFCAKFSTVCDDAAVTTTDSSNAQTTDGSSSSGGIANALDPVTVTVPPASATADSAAMSVRIGCGAVFAAVAAVAFVL